MLYLHVFSSAVVVSCHSSLMVLAARHMGYVLVDLSRHDCYVMPRNHQKEYSPASSAEEVAGSRRRSISSNCGQPRSSCWRSRHTSMYWRGNWTRRGGGGRSNSLKETGWRASCRLASKASNIAYAHKSFTNLNGSWY